MLDMGFRPKEIQRLEWVQIHDNSITIYIAGHEDIATTMKYIHLAGRAANDNPNEARSKGVSVKG